MCTLISADSIVLLAGNPGTLHDMIDRLGSDVMIMGEVERVRR